MINLNKIEKLSFPYPVVIIEDFFEENFLKNILNEFPKYEEFVNFKKTMINRRFLSNDNPDFHKYINEKKFWLEFYKKVNNYNFYKNILNLLLSGDQKYNKFYELSFFDNFYKKNKITFNLSYYLREMSQIIPRIKFFNSLRHLTKKILYKSNLSDGVYLRFDISSASHGYFRTPHTDSDGTILAFLVYLEDQINIGGTGGEFVINDINHNKIKSISPKKNKALFFLSNKKSLHSVSKIKNANGWRKFIYGGFTCTDKKIWSTIND